MTGIEMAIEPDPTTAADEASPATVSQTRCCVVGGGPAGMMLSLLLARRGVPVTLLEAHADFDRKFRGDTIHPSTLELLDQLGLAERLLQLPHTRLDSVTFETPQGRFPVADFRRLKTRFPYIALLPQVEFLNFLSAEAAKYPSFRLVMQADVRELLTDDGKCRGVRYRKGNAWHEVEATLTVAADGRFSRLRKIAKLEPVSTAPPMDVLWFSLSRRPEDSVGEAFHVAGGHLLVVLNRGDHWQMGLMILKGNYPEIREQGIEAFRQTLAAVIPPLADRVAEITDWKQITPLAVESSRLKCWHKPGLLFIGDAAHVMSPVGGVGINYAIQDAVEAANRLARPLTAGDVTDADLARFQRSRDLPTRVIQSAQSFAQNRIIKLALDDQRPFKLPLPLRLPVLRSIPARLIGLGLWRVKLRD